MEASQDLDRLHRCCFPHDDLRVCAHLEEGVQFHEKIEATVFEGGVSMAWEGGRLHNSRAIETVNE